MKISEILELSKVKTIAEIAKERLTIGEKPARAALKRAGCYSIVGQPGWFLDEDADSTILDRSIYEIADQLKEERSLEFKLAANVDSNKLYNDDGKAANELVYRKRHSFDLDVRLVKELKLYSVKEDITLYEAVEEAIYNYLKQKEHEFDLGTGK